MYDGAPSELHASLGTLATIPGGVNAREVNVSRGRRDMERRMIVNRGAMIAGSGSVRCKLEDARNLQNDNSNSRE